MSEFEPRPLHLHTLDSLLADLVSGRPITLGADRSFTLSDATSRSALAWYRAKGPGVWAGSVSAAQAEDLVNSALRTPPDIPPLPARPANANSRRLKLVKVEAHRFAGLHKFGRPEQPPPTFSFSFDYPVTLFEGRNGSGKTSLINAVIWALTGELLRPQREPEKVDTDFEIQLKVQSEADQQEARRIAPITPLPNPSVYRPEKDWVPADTWVELTFADEQGRLLPPIRRSISRSARGTLTEAAPDLAVLGVDPMGVRVGTIMPGLLAHIRVGSESELGRAVSQLTGLAALVELADHVRRAKAKIDREFIRAKTTDRGRADSGYNTAKGDLEKEIANHPALKLENNIQAPSSDTSIESTLQKAQAHFSELAAKAFESGLYPVWLTPA